MADVIHKTTLQQFQSVNTPEYSSTDWIINPDLSSVQSVSQKYWKILGDTVVAMSQAEKDQVDVDETNAQWVVVRAERNKKLSDCDWTQLSDASLSATKVTEWTTYRQELRDIPSTKTDPYAIVWSTKPK